MFAGPNHVAVVTGASRGLGAAIAVALAQRHTRVALLARSAAGLAATAERVTAAGGEARVCPVDLADWDAVAATFEQIASAWGRVDVLVNAAGNKQVGPIEAATRAEAETSLAVNYLGALACCKAVVPGMRARGSGHVLNVSSVLGKRATPTRGLYSASKAALNALTDALRMELAGTGVHVTLVCPGRLADDASQAALAQPVLRSAARIVRCLDRPQRELVLSAPGKALVWFNALAPGLLDRFLLWWRSRERSAARPVSVRGTETR